jgi:beta-lactam-binding protein with PASTA domain
VIGLSASDARARLERLGLSLERAVPAVGTPGLVLGTVPTIGRSVRSGTAVVMIVGVESSRFEPADRTSSASRR